MRRKKNEGIIEFICRKQREYEELEIRLAEKREQFLSSFDHAALRTAINEAVDEYIKSRR